MTTRLTISIPVTATTITTTGMTIKLSVIPSTTVVRLVVNKESLVSSLIDLKTYPYAVPVDGVTTFTLPTLAYKRVVMAFRDITPMVIVSTVPTGTAELQYDPATGIFNVWGQQPISENETFIILYL